MAKRLEAIAGFFRSPAQAEDARQALLSNGFSLEQISFLSGDVRGHETPAVGPLEQVGGDVKSARDGLIGGAVGLAAGVVAVALPGIGPFIAAGPLAAVIGGAGLGAAAGGLVGVLQEHGISDEETKFYAEGVERGGALVTVHVDGERAKEVRKIFEKCGAINVDNLEKAVG